MQYTVLLDNFEGPLDLLLQLVERDKLDIRELMLSDITKSYIEHVRSIDLHPNELNQFLAIATQLVFTKSKRVLPNQPTTVEEMDENDIASQLVRYQRYRALGTEIDKRMNKPFIARPLTTTVTQMGRLDSLAQEISVPVGKLRSAWRKLQSQRSSKPQHHVITQKLTLQQILEKLINHLASVRELTLESLYALAESRHEALLSFLAVLELAKTGQLAVVDSTAERILLQPLVTGVRQ